MKTYYVLRFRQTVRIGILILALGFHIQLTQAQIYHDTICWVWVNDNEFAAKQGADFSLKSDLNALLAQNQVIYYEQALPFAKNPELLKIHELRCNSSSSIDNVINHLSSSFPSKFDRFSKFEALDTTRYVYDPNDGMWQLTTQEPNKWLCI